MSDLDKLRTDFALVWHAERRHLSAADLVALPAARDFAGRYIRQRMTDKQAIQEMAAMYQGMADTIRREQARDERIKAEVRAGRGAA